MTRKPPRLPLLRRGSPKAKLSEAASLWHHIAQFRVLGSSVLKTTIFVIVEVAGDVSRECGRFKELHSDDYT